MWLIISDSDQLPGKIRYNVLILYMYGSTGIVLHGQRRGSLKGIANKYQMEQFYGTCTK